VQPRSRLAQSTAQFFHVDRALQGDPLGLGPDGARKTLSVHYGIGREIVFPLRSFRRVGHPNIVSTGRQSPHQRVPYRTRLIYEKNAPGSHLASRSGGKKGGPCAIGKGKDRLAQRFVQQVMVEWGWEVDYVITEQGSLDIRNNIELPNSPVP
jgi:hypothetical protein